MYETAHFGDDIGSVDGKKNRTRVLPHLIQALSTPPEENAYDDVVGAFHKNTAKTQRSAAALKSSLTDWHKQAQYEAHAQVIFRIRDQYGSNVDPLTYVVTSVVLACAAALACWIPAHRATRVDPLAAIRAA